MARTTMTSLISTLRGMTNAGTADYTSGTATFWTDDQLQAVLDRYRVDVYEYDLRSVEQTDANGDSFYKQYYSDAYKWLESTDGGTAVFFLQLSGGSILGTAVYSADYERGQVTFTQDMGGSSVAMTARSYDVYGAAADVWRQKASYYAVTAYDWSTDNHRVSKSQIVTQCERMAQRYEAMAVTGFSQAQISRSDDVADYE